MTVFELAIGWLAPADCVSCGSEGSILCELCQAAELLPHGERCGFCGVVSASSRTCQKCRRYVGAPRAVFVATDYARSAVKLLGAYKFSHNRSAAKTLANILCDLIKAEIPPKDLSRRNYLVVPIPSTSRRVRERSFDHTALLARRVAKMLGGEFHSPLKRLGQSRQVGAKRPVRLSQLSGQFIAHRPDKIKGRNILLVDDVTTTGATLREATKVLRQSGAAKIDALVFAKRL